MYTLLNTHTHTVITDSPFKSNINQTISSFKSSRECPYLARWGVCPTWQPPLGLELQPRHCFWMASQRPSAQSDPIQSSVFLAADRRKCMTSYQKRSRRTSPRGLAPWWATSAARWLSCRPCSCFCEYRARPPGQLWPTNEHCRPVIIENQRVHCKVTYRAR